MAINRKYSPSNAVSSMASHRKGKQIACVVILAVMFAWFTATAWNVLRLQPNNDDIIELINPNAIPQGSFNAAFISTRLHDSSTNHLHILYTLRLRATEIDIEIAAAIVSWVCSVYYNDDRHAAILGFIVISAREDFEEALVHRIASADDLVTTPSTNSCTMRLVKLLGGIDQDYSSALPDDVSREQLVAHVKKVYELRKKARS